jgi:hypothetical protein
MGEAELRSILLDAGCFRGDGTGDGSLRYNTRSTRVLKDKRVGSLQPSQSLIEAKLRQRGEITDGRSEYADIEILSSFTLLSHHKTNTFSIFGGWQTR